METVDFCFIIIWISCNVCNTSGFPNGDDGVSRKLQTLSSTDQLIQADIQMIKTKVWIEMASQIVQLTKRMNNEEEHRKQLQQTIKSCGCDKALTSSSRVEDELIKKKNMFTKYAPLEYAFQSEKVIRRSNTKDINDLKSNMLKIDQKYDFLVGNSALLQNITNALENEVKTNRNELVQIKDSVHKLANNLNDHLNITLENRSVDSSSFGKPGFNSGWILMKAQDPTLSEMTIPHGLGGLPYKVEVQIKPMSGPNIGMIFHGDSVFQSDDDTGKVYGGIVYLYDNKYVRLFAPKKSNNGATGSIINTGDQESMRIGKHHQVLKQALVRVKAWGHNDIITPDFSSKWISLDRTDSTKVFHEIEHNLNGYPALVNVQIRINSSHGYLVSEGVGASSMGNGWSNAGGVVWGYNEKLVRIWAAFINKPITTSDPYIIFGHNDGWGLKHFNDFNKNQGEIKVMAWSKESMAENCFYRTESSVVEDLLSEISVNTKNDLFQVHVKANDGINKGFHFVSYGNSQSILTPFGGLVSAFSSCGQVRSWRPNSKKKGYLIHIHAPYGYGQCNQASNNATMVATHIKAE